MRMDLIRITVENNFEINVIELFDRIVELFSSKLSVQGYKRRGNIWSKSTGNNLIKFHIRQSKFGYLPTVTYGIVLKKYLNDSVKFGNEDYHFYQDLDVSIGRFLKIENYKWSMDDHIDLLLKDIEATFESFILKEVEALSIADGPTLFNAVQMNHFILCYLRRSDLLE
jgi:hypothetical protein